MQKLRFSFHLGLNLEAFSVCEVFIKSLKSPTKIKSVFKEVLMLNFVWWLNMKTPLGYEFYELEQLFTDIVELVFMQQEIWIDCTLMILPSGWIDRKH